jgi:hypothetical protein
LLNGKDSARKMEIELWQLNNIIKAAAEEAVKKYVIAQNPSDDEISERQAYREFGTGWVQNQVACGLIKPGRMGACKNSKKVYSRSALSELKYGVNPLLKSVTN